MPRAIGPARKDRSLSIDDADVQLGPEKGDFLGSSDPEDGQPPALPDQEEFWRPPVRFGSIPVEKEPLGWDQRRGFRKLVADYTHLGLPPLARGITEGVQPLV